MLDPGSESGGHMKSALDDDLSLYMSDVEKEKYDLEGIYFDECVLCEDQVGNHMYHKSDSVHSTTLRYI